MAQRIIGVIFCLLAIQTFSTEEAPREDLFLSTPEQLATLNSESSWLIGGIVSPLSGQPVLKLTDLVVRGAQNIVLQRTYLSPHMPCLFPRYKSNQIEHDNKHLYYYLRDNYKGWQFYPHLRLEFNPRSNEVCVCDPNGMTLKFHLSGPRFSTVSLATLPFAMSNAIGDKPSGNYDSRNTRILCEEEGNKISVLATDGVTRIYRKKGWMRQSFWYLLEKEILSNGKVLKYYYDDRGQLHHIESLDPKERYVYASLFVEGTSWEGHCHFTSSSGLCVDYKYQKRPIQWKFSERIQKHTKYEEESDFICPPILTSVSSPFYRHESLDYCGRFLLGACYGKEKVFHILNDGFGEREKYFRVHKLLLPVGQNDAFIPVYEFSYQPPIAGSKDGTTTVKQSDGTAIVYHISKSLLISLIQYYDQNGNLRKEKAFYWDDRNWLKTIEIRDSYKNLIFGKTFEYDSFGNPILEIFTGDLTGEGNRVTFTTKRTFSLEGRNLLLKEETEDGKTICFSYLANTDLVTSKLTKDGDRIILRDFFIYDDCNNLVQTITDDGSSEDRNSLCHVSQRTLTKYILRESAPFLHMPEWIEDFYWESGTEKSLKKSHLVYDQHGNIAQEEIYDAEGEYAYTIYKTYNERGDVLSETNCLGQRANYTYDGRGRPETATNFSDRMHKTFRYDTKGRLRELTEKGDDGVVHVISSDYDFYDRQIHKKDPFSNSTYYTHDPLVNQVIKTEFPPIASLEGQLVSVSTFSGYDCLGRELTKTDANGNTIVYRYNAYGSPIEISYPHGGRETFRYAKNGQLVCQTNLDGLTIYYKRDVLGRALSKTYASSVGQTLAEETFAYNGFNLITETDKEGNRKQYFYDGAGRKIRDDFCGHITDLKYDSLGRVTETCEHNRDNTLFSSYMRDFEGKILQKLKTDAAGYPLYKISYGYDGDGNREKVIRYIDGKEAIETFSYDSFCRLVRYQDGEGFSTTTNYNENFINPLGQRVLQKKIIDPRNISTLATKDPLNRTIRTEVLNPQGNSVACHELIYDPQGNLLSRKDHIYENNRFRNVQDVKYVYTSDHQVESLTRGFGSPNARSIIYTYQPSGKIATKRLPDGVILTYGYNPLGFLGRVDSSDGKIRHVFEYNRLGQLICTLDENHHIAIRRELDPFGNVIRENFPFGHEINKFYDSFNRVISLKIKNHGELLYAYDSLFLRQVTRVSEIGEKLYSHDYVDYDLDGNLVAEQMINGLGFISHLTSARGQKLSISTPYFMQNCQYDSIGNLVNNIVDRTEWRYTYDDISQLSSENNLMQSIGYIQDSAYNRIQKNDELYEVNELNEVVSLDNMHNIYDLNGNQILGKAVEGAAQYTYDPLNRLTEVITEKTKINFAYDPLDRRLSKTVYTLSTQGWEEIDLEHYLYDGQNEIGAFTASHELKNFRALGLSLHRDNSTTVGVEIGGQIFAPVLDVQGNIRRLISSEAKTVTAAYDFTAFGEMLQSNLESRSLLNPWRFASKRLDLELDLIYFGKRYYNPQVGRWLSTDPAGFVDSYNLYQYVLNNPFRFQDPTGESLGGYLLGLGEIALGGALMLTGGLIEIGSFGTLTLGFALAESAGIGLIGHGFSLTTTHAKDLSFEKRSSRPDPDLRAEGYPHSIIQIPGADGSYTTHNGDGTYKQYRGSGKPHGNISRPNVKETKNNPSPTGPRPGKPEVRKPTSDEIPK